MASDWDIVEQEKKQEWDDFVLRSPQRSIFVQTKFLDALQSDYRLVTCRDHDRIVAGTVIMLDQDSQPLRSIFPFTQYQGILLADNSDLPNHSRLAREFKLLEFFIANLAARFHHFCLCQSWHLQDLRPFQWFNYHEPDKNHFRLDLRYSGVLTKATFQNTEHHLATVRVVRRQEFYKASHKLQLVKDVDEDVLSYLYHSTFARQGIAVSKEEDTLIRSILRKSIADGFGQMIYALENGLPISATLFLYDDRTAYYLFGANDPEYRKSFGNVFLLITMLRDAFALGLEEVDMVGVNSPNRADFKLSLNADLRPYFITTL